MLNLQKFEEFISQYPIFEYRLMDAASIATHERVRVICREECERYNTTWACPPAVGTIEECDRKIHEYSQGILFSSVAEVSDVLNFDETLKTRHAHEKITDAVGSFLRNEGKDIYILSTESCDLCEHCAYLEQKPCRHPEYMHPCVESHGVVVSELVEREQMEYNLGGGTVLWFSLILFRDSSDSK